MRLRRISEHIREQNWFAVCVDFAIVVIGVFIGIQVSNWNETRGDRAAEKAHIERLIAEYEQNLEMLVTVRERHSQVLAAVSDVNSLTSPLASFETVDPAISELLGTSFLNPTFIPRLGATDALLSSGKLSLIRDADIQRRLSDWPSRAEEVREWQIIERDNLETIILQYALNYVAFESIAASLETDIEKTGAFQNDFEGLFRSKRFHGMMVNRAWNLNGVIQTIETVEAETEQMLQLMNERLEEIS